MAPSATARLRTARVSKEEWAALQRLRWHLLIHSLPPKPLYLRAKIRTRLQQAGAVALKNAVYVLPDRPGCLETLHSIGEDAIAGGGKAYVCEAEFLDPETDASLIEEFRSERETDYAALAKVVGGWDGRTPERPLVARERKRLERIMRIDFFEAPGRRRAESLLGRAEARTNVPANRSSSTKSDLAGRVWATRPGVQIDRIASAWLIRRFIDPSARFRFVDPETDRGPDELRFDTVGGDFTHEGDACTFETLVRSLPNLDLALREVAEIVHDIDLKDGKFGRSDAPGVQQLVLGIVLDCPDDEERLERGFGLFDNLYASFRNRNPLGKETLK